MPQLEDVFDFKGFYERLQMCGVESKRICDMDKKDIVNLLYAFSCYQPTKCVYCRKFIASKTAGDNSGVCGIDYHPVPDCLALCEFLQDVVPFS